MDRIKVIHDTVGHTLTVWLGDPQQEYLSTLTDDEVVIMKDRAGRVLASKSCTTSRQEPQTDYPSTLVSCPRSPRDSGRAVQPTRRGCGRSWRGSG